MAKKINPLDSFFESFSDGDQKVSVKLAIETLGEKVPVVRTGSLILDDILSSGGYPCGRIIQLYGPPGSGKTLMAMIAIKEAQLKDPKALQLFIDAEQTFNVSWADKLGLDTSKIVVLDGDDASNGRRCFEMLLGVPKEDAKTHVLKGKSKEGLLDKITKKELNFNLITLDSLGAIVPPIEDVARVGKSNMAALARFLTQEFRKLAPEVSKAKIPFIVINHKRDSLDMYGPDHTFSGGNSYAHSLSANVYFERVNRKDASILNEKEEVVGYTVRATVEKSKFGPWPKKGEFRVHTDVGIVDDHVEIFNLAVDYNVISKPNAMMYEFGEFKWKGAEACKNAIKEDSVLATSLKEQIEISRDGLQQSLRDKQERTRDSVFSSATTEDEVDSDE